MDASWPGHHVNSPRSISLAAEVGRIAATLAALSSELSAASCSDTGRTTDLNQEVGRAASTLASLSRELSTAAGILERETQGFPIQTQTIRAVIHHRRLRGTYFEEDLFADPAWDMMLRLMLAELMHVRMSVSDLCDAAGVPATTALRWQKSLVERGILVRRPDPHDARRVFVELSSEASEALRRYFADFGVGDLPVDGDAL